jgi:hypothetical protein
VSRFKLNRAAVGADQNRSHEAKWAKALRHAVWLKKSYFINLSDVMPEILILVKRIF